jgi:hypothetical protein
MANLWEFPWDKAVTELLAEFPTHEVWAVAETYGDATYSARRWGAHPRTTMIRHTPEELREAIKADLAGDLHPKAHELTALGFLPCQKLLGERPPHSCSPRSRRPGQAHRITSEHLGVPI